MPDPSLYPQGDTPSNIAPVNVREEIEHYKQKLEHSCTAYKIVEQKNQPDGSVIVKIIKQHNSYPIHEYLK